jgi:hypothetical protein
MGDGDERQQFLTIYRHGKGALPTAWLSGTRNLAFRVAKPGFPGTPLYNAPEAVFRHCQLPVAFVEKI